MWPTVFKLPWFDLPIRGYGLMLMIGFLGGTWWAARRALRVKGDPDFVVNLGFLALIASVVGARIFFVVHYWDTLFAGRGLRAIVDVSAGGLEFYGGLIGALVACGVYTRLTGHSLRLYLDIVAPSLMFGMGMARIGCFLNGCCWGGPCSPDMAWSVRFPYSSPAFIRQWHERMATAPAELIYVSSSGAPYRIDRDLLGMTPEERQRGGVGCACRKVDPKVKANALAPLVRQERSFDLTASEIEAIAHKHGSIAVHPVQLYASLDGLILAVMLNAYFYRRKRHGTVFAVMLLIYPLMRIAEEIIRIDNPHDTAGLTISQFVSLSLIVAGLVYLYILRRAPLRSPRAVPWVPPPPEPGKKKG